MSPTPKFKRAVNYTIDFLKPRNIAITTALTWTATTGTVIEQDNYKKPLTEIKKNKRRKDE